VTLGVQTWVLLEGMTHICNSSQGHVPSNLTQEVFNGRVVTLAMQ